MTISEAKKFKKISCLLTKVSARVRSPEVRKYGSPEEKHRKCSDTKFRREARRYTAKGRELESPKVRKSGREMQTVRSRKSESGRGMQKSGVGKPEEKYNAALAERTRCLFSRT